MRACGILMPIFSLPSPYGIGSFGEEAYRFVDFLRKAGQRYWQLLPLGPTGYGDSPYQSFSAFAGNPYFIDLDLLVQDGLLTKAEITACDFGDDPHLIDYGKLYDNRLPLLRRAFARFTPDGGYETFCRDNAWWLDDYVLLTALKRENDDRSLEEWDDALRLRDPAALSAARTRLAEETAFYRFVQYKFSCQWHALKEYANQNGVYLIGDLPIYVSYDSADVWAEPAQFLLDKRARPELVAGVPPDAFSEDGQLWGNPLYDWAHMKADGYAWWKRRLRHAFDTYDVIRIDHFRAFESYFAIPYGEKTAQNGEWVKGPGMALFDELRREFGGELPIIAEDLGLLTPAVHELLDETGFPGMKVLQFAFAAGQESNYLPHRHVKNSVVYTGTHDNDTCVGWADTADKDDVALARRYLNASGQEGFNWAMIRAALMSVADTAVLPMADFIGLGSEARINTPATLGGNWTWRIAGGCINDWLAGIIREQTALYGRLAPQIEEK